jgi:hypothetical protein
VRALGTEREVPPNRRTLFTHPAREDFESSVGQVLDVVDFVHFSFCIAVIFFSIRTQRESISGRLNV